MIPTWPLLILKGIAWIYAEEGWGKWWTWSPLYWFFSSLCLNFSLTTIRWAPKWYYYSCLWLSPMCSRMWQSCRWGYYLLSVYVQEWKVGGIYGVWPRETVDASIYCIVLVAVLYHPCIFERTMEAVSTGSTLLFSRFRRRYFSPEITII